LSELKTKAPLSDVRPVLFIVMTLIFVFILYQIIGGIIGVFFYEDIPKFRLVLIFSQIMFLLFPAYILNYLRGKDFKEVFLFRAPDMKIFWISILGIIVIQPFIQMISAVQTKIIFSLPIDKSILDLLKNYIDSVESSVLKIVASNSYFEFIIVCLVIAVTPAVCEEFLFRGLIFSNFRSFLNPRKAIFLTGLLFALFHFDPFNLIPLIILGIYLTLIAYFSNSILTAITVHFLNNFISAMAVYFFGSEFASSTRDIPQDEFSQLIYAGILSLLLFILVLYIMFKINKRNSVGTAS
jgi:uncharacterized protein